MTNILVSVIVPIYNVEEFLEECLFHLEQQTLKEIEIILVNDGSTDGSPEIAQRYADRNNNFRLINRENGGLSAARNTGIKYASGKYLYFIDSDDYLADTALYELFQVAEQNSLDVLKFSAYTFEAHSMDFEWEIYKYKGKYDGVCTGVQLLEKVIDNRDNIVSCCLIFIRRELVEEYQLRFYEGIIHEDNLFHWSLLTLSQRVMVYNKPLYYRRYRSGSIMRTENHYQRFRGLVLSAIEADRFKECHSNIKGTRIDWYIYHFLMTSNDSYRFLDKNQRNITEIRNLYKENKRLLIKYRKVAYMKAMLFVICPSFAWLCVDGKKLAGKYVGKKM